MFRTARITFQEAGLDPVTDIFRVFTTETMTAVQQWDEVRVALHDGGIRNFRVHSWEWAD